MKCTYFVKTARLKYEAITIASYITEINEEKKTYISMNLTWLSTIFLHCILYSSQLLIFTKFNFTDFLTLKIVLTEAVHGSIKQYKHINAHRIKCFQTILCSECMPINILKYYYVYALHPLK